jgi:septal ring factor EnvC (AmiA/AmiB activator)
MALDLKSKNENLRYTRLQYQESQNYISQLQQDIEDLHKQKEKYKNDSFLF